MKRLAIYVIYDSDGMVDEYIYDVVSSIKENVDCLIVVSNSKLADTDWIRLKRIVDYVCVRDNIGYDAGAYKEIIVGLAENGELYNYDQLILMNDSFFGFFYDIKEFFDWSVRKEGLDFSGMTKNTGGYTEHVQSYFMLINKKIINSREFISFWKDMKFAKTLVEAVENFEVRFTKFFSELGYNWDVYCDIQKSGVIIEENPYLEYSVTLIEKYRCPIIKRKSIDYYAGCAAIEYICKEKGLCTDKYYNYLKRMHKNGTIEIDAQGLKQFCESHKTIYVYGAGKLGKGARQYLRCMKYKFGGYIVSNGNSGGISIEDMRLDEDDGVILALNKKNMNEVMDKYGDLLKEADTFSRGDC